MKRATILISATLLTAASLCAQGIDGTWKGTLNAGAQKLTIVLHIDQAKSDVKMDVIEQGAKGVAMTVSHLSADSISAGVPQLMLTYDGKLDNGKITGTFRQQTFATGLTLEPGTVTLNRPQEPKAPYPYKTEEVTFTNPTANVALAGTLTYPTGWKEGERVPVVLMVSGSGPQNRDEEVFGHRPFLVIADHLARNGIASLRYDDRGCGASTGSFNDATTADFCADAGCGVDYLRRLNRFSAIGVLGHSEGGAVAYMLGSEGKPDFIVSIAGPACRIDTMMMMQLNKLARVQGAPTDIVNSVEQARQAMMKSGGTEWLKAFIDLDMAPYVKATRCPVMAIGGSNDLNVPAELNTAALEDNLPKNPSNIVKTYQGLNHMMQHHPTGNPVEAANIEETISQEVLKDISAWINSLHAKP